MECCDLLTAVSLRFVSFAWRYLGSSAIRPRRPQTLSRRIIPEFAVPVAPGPVVFEELSGSPKFPGNPHDHSPCSQTPARPDPREGTNCQRIRHGPRIRSTAEALHNRISGLNHTAFGLAVYASQWKLPATTQDSLPVAGPRLYRAGFEPAGFLRKVSNLDDSSSFPELLRATCPPYSTGSASLGIHEQEGEGPRTAAWNASSVLGVTIPPHHKGHRHGRTSYVLVLVSAAAKH